MLDELRVENLGIIETATIEPGPGLVAVTGETGAGKTLLLGALRLLRGDAARSDRIGPHGDEARVEGRFIVADQEIVASRRVGANRSRAYLDREMVPARVLAGRLGDVIEIVAQHEHLTLGRERSLRALVDGRLDAEGAAVRGTYVEAYGRLASLQSEFEALGGDQRVLERELDLARHQSAEIEAAGLVAGEDESLAASLRRMRHAEEITESLAAAQGNLHDEGAAIDMLRSSLDAARSAAKLDPDLERIAVTLEGLIVGVEDVVGEVRAVLDSTDLDPSELSTAEARQATLADLKRKYGGTITEVIDFGRTAAERAEEIARLLERADTIATELVDARRRAEDAGSALAAVRRAAAEGLTAAALTQLRTLGFRDPVLRLAVENTDPKPSGADTITLEFASDAALTAGPVNKVASGGELSRLVLAVRVAAGAAEVPVVAFDEVDAGVGGATALAMGEQLAALAATGQVLVVTHLPQVAAFADRHFVVERSGPSASVRRVEGNERLVEIARMLGGMEESDRGRLHAEELLERAADRHGSS